jgi:hypothetical protein
VAALAAPGTSATYLRKRLRISTRAALLQQELCWAYYGAKRFGVSFLSLRQPTTNKRTNNIINLSQFYA